MKVEDKDVLNELVKVKIKLNESGNSQRIHIPKGILDLVDSHDLD